MSAQQDVKNPGAATAPDDEDAVLLGALARAGVSLPTEWLAATAAESRDLRAKIARLREWAST
jgi:hypothetical protein